MDALEQLVKDHAESKEALAVIAKSWGTKKMELFKTLKRDLELHGAVEKSIVSPALKAHPKAKSLPQKSDDAHANVEKALDRLSKMMTDDPDWIPVFNSMRERLLKHIGSEESVFYVKVREALTSAELRGLGERMAAERERLRKAARQEA
jgi:hypothetical protein